MTRSRHSTASHGATASHRGAQSPAPETFSKSLLSESWVYVWLCSRAQSQAGTEQAREAPCGTAGQAAAWAPLTASPPHPDTPSHPTRQHAAESRKTQHWYQRPLQPTASRTPCVRRRTEPVSSPNHLLQRQTQQSSALRTAPQQAYLGPGSGPPGARAHFPAEVVRQVAGQAPRTEPQGRAQRALESQGQPLGVRSQAPAQQGPGVGAPGTMAPWRGGPAGRRGGPAELHQESGEQKPEVLALTPGT